MPIRNMPTECHDKNADSTATGVRVSVIAKTKLNKPTGSTPLDPQSLGDHASTFPHMSVALAVHSHSVDLVVHSHSF